MRYPLGRDNYLVNNVIHVLYNRGQVRNKGTTYYKGFFFRTKKRGRFFEGGHIFQILLTGSHALNIVLLSH